MQRRSLLLGAVLAASTALAGLPAMAQAEPFKVGLILPMTGPFASTGRQIEAAAKLYIAEHGDEVAGRRIELIVKDDASVADTTKRLAQELIVRDKVGALAGFGLTPLAMATAPLSTRAKVPTVVMAAATSSITETSPYVVRTSYTTPQVTSKIAEWAATEGMKRVVTVVSDYGPASMPKRPSPRSSPPPAARSRTCACRCRTRISRPSCRRSPTASPTRSSPSRLRAWARSS
ncbi:ABC transporter substrate-binding protein [Paracoccus sp. PS-1]|uniref:ABC transporter substrate-binding protein n=1 Tax=Paracoccus sp. PS1 TaxID=2963938 RepID=UPI0027E4E8EC|nr:ABC transporter substrate-binding protein [Paracoccus sp. PS1]MDQ7263073.1 ABC transporter substrate-binding protein [Paracoccus sp. PS1]